MEKSSVHRIVAGVKRYLGLQREYVMLSFVEKLTILLTALFVWGVVSVQEVESVGEQGLSSILRSAIRLQCRQPSCPSPYG